VDALAIGWVRDHVRAGSRGRARRVRWRRVGGRGAHGGAGRGRTRARARAGARSRAGATSEKDKADEHRQCQAAVPGL